MVGNAARLLILGALAWSAAALPENLRGTWSATGAGPALMGTWTARFDANRKEGSGTWTLLDRAGSSVAGGTWSASKAGAVWRGTWKAQVARPFQGVYSGTWAAEVKLPGSSTFADMLEAGLSGVVSGSWRMTPSRSGLWSIRAYPEK